MNEKLYWHDRFMPEPSLDPPAYNPPERYCDQCGNYVSDGCCWCNVGHDPLSLDYASVCEDFEEEQ